MAIAFYNAMKSIIHNFRRKNDYHAPLPEEVPERKLLITDFDKDVLRKRLCRMAKGNENLIKVIMYIIDDPDVKPGELALELDESPAAIYKKKRELRRLSSKLREKDTH